MGDEQKAVFRNRPKVKRREDKRYDPAHAAASAKKQLEQVSKEISSDIPFFELHVDHNKLRVHGFRAGSAFFLVLLDHEHRVFPM